MTARRHNIAALGAVQLFRFSAAIAVSIALARGLGVSGYGTYATIATATHLLAFLANAGVHQLLPRAIARAQPGQQYAWVRAGLWITAAGTGLALVALLVWAWVWDASAVFAVVLAGASLGLMSLVNVYMAAFEGIRRMALQLWGVLLGRLTFVLGTLGVLALGGGLVPVFGVQLAAWAVTLALFAWTLGLVMPRSPASVPPGSLVRDALPFAGFVAFAAVQERVDVLVLEAFRGAEEVGLYRAASLFVINVPVAARILSTAAYPALARAHADGASLQPELQRILRLLTATGLAFAVGGSVVGPALLQDVLGSEYAAAGPLLAVVAWVVPLIFVRIALDLALLATDGERTRLRGMGVAAGVNVALNLLLVPSIGVAAAIGTTLLSEALLVGLYAWPLRADLGAVRTWLPSALAPAVVLFLLLFLPISPWLSAAVASVAWLATGWAVGTWSPADLRALRAL